MRTAKGSRHSSGDFEVTSSSEEEEVRLAMRQSPHVVCMACLGHMLVNSRRETVDCILPWKCDSYIGVSHPYSCRS